MAREKTLLTVRAKKLRDLMQSVQQVKEEIAKEREKIKEGEKE